MSTFKICPNTMILRENKILLLRRADWAPLWASHWHCPTGKMEGDETPRQCAVRETFEEVGLHIEPTLGTVVDVHSIRYDKPDEPYRDLSLFFVAEAFEDEPVNREPRLHDAMEWFDISDLPDPIIPVVKFGIEQYAKGAFYGEYRRLENNQ